jgi:hypothetical protein
VWGGAAGSILFRETGGEVRLASGSAGGCSRTISFAVGSGSLELSTLAVLRCTGHGKTLGLPVLHRFLQFDGFRGPQFKAAALLLIYLLQCVWLVRVKMLQSSTLDSDQGIRIYLGLQQWRGGAVAGTPESMRSEAATGLPSAARSGNLRVLEGYDQDRSPLYYLLASAPFLFRPPDKLPQSLVPFVAAAPQIFFGIMLGGSLWYVSRRLYGNAGGYIALGFYCFSPEMIINAASEQSLGEMAAVWGAFGSIFTAIAVAHTLYAPREVVLWNWRRILLLGLAVALAVGNQFSLAVLAVAILPLMLWVAPVRPRAVLVIWVTAIAVAATLIFASYWFEPTLFWQGLLRAHWFDFEPMAVLAPVSYRSIAHSIISGSPPLMLALPVALMTYLGWKRARYFGNTLPLLIAGLLVAMLVCSPGFRGQGFSIAMLVFLFVFVAGVFSDLLQTERSVLVSAGLWGLMGVSAMENIRRLLRLA